MNLLDYAVLALATAGLAAFVRAISFWPKHLSEKKPLGCPVCMSGWCAFIVLALAHQDGLVAHWTITRYPLAWLVCVAVSALIYKTLYPPQIDLPLPGDEP